MRRARGARFRCAGVFAACAALVAVSCDRSPQQWVGQVTIGVDLEAGQRWTAQGTPVERGQFCPKGIRHVLEGRDPTTDDIVRVPVWSQIIEEAIAERNTTEIDLVVEHTCTDGSGSFVTIEHWGTDAWSVDSGTGAYRALTGGGALVFATAHYTEVKPLRLYLDGELHGELDG